MKIGFFLPNATFDLPGSPEVGGIETFAFTMGEAMQDLGHQVILFGGKPKLDRKHRETQLTLELFPYWETNSIPDIGTRFQRLAQRVHFGWVSRHAWLNHHFDAAILAKPFDWPVAAAWKRKQPNLKVIMGFHGTDFFLGDSYFFRSVDQSFAVSPQVAKLAYNHLKIKPAIIPNPVDVDFFNPGKSIASDKTGALKLVASGRLIGWKGFDILIKAIDLLNKENFNVSCFIAGEGPEKASLKKLICEKNLQNQIKLCGQLNREALRDLLRNGEAYVAPSIGMEAFSIAALEAASVGLPLLLSDQVGLKDYLTPADCLSYPARDVNRLAAVIRELDRRRNDAVWNNRQERFNRVKGMFSPEMAAQKIIKLIDSVP